MHAFTDLVQRSTSFTLNSLEEVESKVLSELEERGATHLVKALQMIELQKTIFAVGMFSIFEASLQDELGCKDGFLEAKKILSEAGKDSLHDSFSDLQLAINVLKHGLGRSYDLLAEKAHVLPFKMKLPDQAFFDEGDVSEVKTLIYVDNAFVLRCSDVIDEVSTVVKDARPNYNG